MKWYNKITDSPDDFGPVGEALMVFEMEVEKAKEEYLIRGSIEKQSSMLPGHIGYRMTQYQEIVAIRKHLQMKLDREKHKAFKKFLESYNRTLTSRDAEKYAEADDAVYAIAQLLNHVDLLKGAYEAVLKAFDIKHWQLSNLVKIKCAGFEDYEVNF